MDCILISDTSDHGDDFQSTGKPRVRKRRTRREHKLRSLDVGEEVICISDDEFEPQNVRYRRPQPQKQRSRGRSRMGSPASSPLPVTCTGKLEERKQRTWCVERAERARISAASTLIISSDSDSDSLPDLSAVSAEEDDNIDANDSDSMQDSRRDKDRHFSDVIACKIKQRSDRISAEKQAGSAPTEPENIFVLRYPELPVKGKGKVWEKQQCEKGSTDCEASRKKFKHTRVRFLRKHVTTPVEEVKNCQDFSMLQEMMLEAAYDENFDQLFFGHFLDLLTDFSLTRKPTVGLMKNLIKNGLYYQDSLDIAHSTYHAIMAIWTRYPDLVDFDWQLMLSAGEVVSRGLQTSQAAKCKGRSQRDGEPGFAQAQLYFRLGVFGLRQNLSQCVLADAKSVRSSLAAASLSVDNFTVVVRLTHWLGNCLVALEQPNDDTAEGVRWIWSLQELLDMCVLVSRDRLEAAKRLANEILRLYIYLPGLKEKKKLLQTTHCPLLCFCFVRLVLENYCAETMPSTSFPETVHDLTNSYFPALPPRSPMTPPPSPSDEEEAAMDGQNSFFSGENCEELCLLVYFLTSSYITCRQKRLHQDLRQQVLKGADETFPNEDDQEELKEASKDFEKHLSDLTAELTPDTMAHLAALQALCYV